MAKPTTMERPSVAIPLRLSESTKERLRQKSFERKQSQNSNLRQKKALNDSLGKWTNPMAESAVDGSSLRKKRSVKKLNSDLGGSSHGRKPVKKTSSADRVVRPGDNNGKLGNMLEEMSKGKPKKKGSRSVVSDMPSRRRSENDDRSAVTEVRKPRHPDKHYPGQLKRTQSSTPRRHASTPTSSSTEKRRARSQSPHGLRKRTQSPGALSRRRERSRTIPKLPLLQS